MTINKELSGTTLTVKVEGRLDTTTAPQLESELKESLTGINELNLDFAALEYISSAGLRQVIVAYKKMAQKDGFKIINKQGKMIVRNVNEIVMDVFEVTGFVDILTIE